MSVGPPVQAKLPMRICHLIYDDLANPWLGGGGALRAREIYRRLADRHEITVVSGRFPGARQEETVDGMRVLRVGSERGYALSRLGYMARAVGVLERESWDVWVNEFSAFAPLRVPRALRRQGVLYFYHFVGGHALRKHPVAGGVAWAAERLALRGYPRIVTISPSVAEEVGRRLSGRDVAIDCVYTGVEVGYFDLEPAEESYILYFGRTDVHTKGMDLLIEAFARVADGHPNLQLRIAGRGAPRERRILQDLVSRSGVSERIEVIGDVDEETKGGLLRHCQFLCMPSRYEGWGIAAVEAQAAGRPVLGTRIPGLTDAVQDGETGLLVEPGDAETLRSGMEQMLADPGRRQEMGRAGRAWARRFDWDQIARDQETVLARAAAENAAADTQ